MTGGTGRAGVRIACVYVNAGKGHYIPAKALADGFAAIGIEAVMVDYFSLLGARRLDALNQWLWRLMLRSPRLEQMVNRGADHSRFIAWALPLLQWLSYEKAVRAHVDEHQWDAMICTQYMPSMILPSLMKRLGTDIPIFAYASDVFFTPRQGLHPDLAKFYISTSEGAEHVVRSGFPREKTMVSAFPIQRSCVTAPALTKEEAREKLALKPIFTVLVNLGGEGIGTSRLIDELEERRVAVQVVLVGGMHKHAERKLLDQQRLCTAVTVHVAGFVDNIYDYLRASDVVVGKAGINAMLEAIYLRRPFLVTTVYYSVADAAHYVVTHDIGWYEPHPERQAAIICSCIEDPALLAAMDRNFDSLPIRFGADEIVRDVVETVAGKTKEFSKVDRRSCQ